eukprot:scaffold329752_cov77-Tisochrysis_lutea.AAC.1
MTQHMQTPLVAATLGMASHALRQSSTTRAGPSQCVSGSSTPARRVAPTWCQNAPRPSPRSSRRRRNRP